jgi:hypothetical protein
MDGSGSCPVTGFSTDGDEHWHSVSIVLINSKYMQIKETAKYEWR